ncbi:MAG: hypothetical protein ABIR55_03680 [Burkholderiaceae bacterium]
MEALRLYAGPGAIGGQLADAFAQWVEAPDVRQVYPLCALQHAQASLHPSGDNRLLRYAKHLAVSFEPCPAT